MLQKSRQWWEGTTMSEISVNLRPNLHCNNRYSICLEDHGQILLSLSDFFCACSVCERRLDESCRTDIISLNYSYKGLPIFSHIHCWKNGQERIRNYLLKLGQANPCELGSVHPIYVFINTLFFPNVVSFWNSCDYSFRTFSEEV